MNAEQTIAEIERIQEWKVGTRRSVEAYCWLRPGSRCHTAAKAETTDYARPFRRAVDSQPKGRLDLAVGCPAPGFSLHDNRTGTVRAGCNLQQGEPEGELQLFDEPVDRRCEYRRGRHGGRPDLQRRWEGDWFVHVDLAGGVQNGCFGRDLHRERQWHGEDHLYKRLDGQAAGAQFLTNLNESGDYIVSGTAFKQ